MDYRFPQRSSQDSSSSPLSCRLQRPLDISSSDGKVREAPHKRQLSPQEATGPIMTKAHLTERIGRMPNTAQRIGNQEMRLSDTSLRTRTMDVATRPSSTTAATTATNIPPTISASNSHLMLHPRTPTPSPSTG